jgi:hypothetical protein
LTTTSGVAGILAGVPDDEQAKPGPDHDRGIARGDCNDPYKIHIYASNENYLVDFLQAERKVKYDY